MWNDLLAQMSDLLSGYGPNVLGALLILVGGWLAAILLSALVRGALRRTTVDNRIAEWMAGTEGADTLAVEKVISRVVFYLVMLFVLVAFFQALNLTLVTGPLTALLTQITQFLPRLLAAAFLLAGAWVVATALRTIVHAALRSTGLDRSWNGDEEATELPLSKTVSDAVYWLVYLLFLPAILGALAIGGLLEPVQGLTDQLLGFLPNLLAAALIFAVGWFAARLVQRVVTNLLAAAGADRLATQVGIDTALGNQRLSSLLGLILYVLILLPVLISSLNALQLDAITAPASEMLRQIFDAIPRLFAASLLLALAYFVGRLIAGLLENLLAGGGFNGMLARLGLGAATEGVRAPSAIAASLIMVAIMLFATVEAAGLLGFDTLANLVSSFIVFGGQVVLGVVLFSIGLFLSNLAADTIRTGATPQSATLAIAARVAIIVLAGAMALRQMGLANEIINLAFGLLLGAIAVAVGLAFGLGSREVAGEKMREWVHAWDARRQ